MSLTHSEFKVLYALSQTGDALTQRAIADKTGLSLGTVNSTLKSCTEQGLVADGRLTGGVFRPLSPIE